MRKEQWSKLIINGFECFAYIYGIYSFKKQEKDYYLLIECSDDDLKNGNIKFMIENHLTIGEELKRKIENKFKKLNNGR